MKTNEQVMEAYEVPVVRVVNVHVEHGYAGSVGGEGDDMGGFQ